jgi:two-component system KDP operon response regulator KdpE
VIILLVDDDQRLLDALEWAFQFHWPDTELLTARDGETALRLCFAREPDVVVLDVKLPDRSGFDVLREIRRASDVPVLMLTAARDEMDQVRGLGLGADNYLTKPVGPTALLAFVKAALRRSQPSDEANELTVGGLRIHSQRREVLVEDQLVRLTPIEHRLLYQLMRNAGHVLTYATLIRRVWGSDEGASEHELRVFIARLRAKIEAPGRPQCIATEREVGYRFLTRSRYREPGERARLPPTESP